MLLAKFLDLKKITFMIF